jgi:PAS domain S-box-containing protein
MGENCPPIVAIDSGDVEIAVRAFKKGVADYLVRDRMTPDDLRSAMRSAIESAELKRELQCSQERFHTSVENMLDCFGIFSAMRGESGQIVDFRIDYLNAAACENNRMPKQMQVGRGLCEVLPSHRESGLFDEYCRLVETGEPLIKDSLIYEDTFGDRQLIRAFDIRATKLNDGFVASWRDVTDRKRLEVELSQTVTDLQQQKHRLQRLIDTAPIGIGIASASGEVTVINDAMLHLHGLTREEFEQGGMDWRDFSLPEQSQTNERAMARLWQQGFVPPEEKEILRRDGTRVPIWIGATQWMDGTDEHVAFAVDLTQLKQAEAALLESEERFRNMADNAPIMVWVTDATGNCTYLSKSWYKFTGQTEAEGLGLGWLEAVHPEDREVSRDNFLRANERQAAFRLEYRLHRQDGEYRYCIDAASPWFGEEGEFKGYIGSVIDISDRKRAEEALKESERRFRTLADNISQFAWMADRNGWIFWYNQRWFEYTGTTLEEMQGWGWQKVHHPDYVERVVEKISRCYETGQPWEDTFPLRGKDGRYRWFLSRALPIRDEAGNISCWFGTNTDITKRKRAEEALKESEDRLRMAIESAQLGTWDWNLTTDCLTWDANCKAMFGLPPEAQSSIESFFEALHPDERERLEGAIQRSLSPASGGNYDVEYRTIGIQDGIERWIAAKGQVYFDSAGKPQRFIGTVLDITEQKQAEARREQLLEQEQAAREAAERANRIKDEFLAILSHELRTPLNPILGWSRLLQTRKFNETKTAEALATIERNARLQIELIDDLLDIAKILRGKLNLKITSVHLSSAIAAAIETIEMAATAKSISLHQELPNIGQISGDAARFQQIVCNLLSNAIKFTPPGGRVDIRLARVGDRAEITVRDTGKGIRPDFLPHIFESFRQEDASIERKYGGLGLGLAIVRQLVEAHGGTITADSPGEGLGAIFTVRLPLLNVAPQMKQTEELPCQEPDLAGIRVLTVDDEPDARELLTVLLTQYGATVKSVASAAEVLATFQSFQPDVLVIDIGMPEVDGYTLIQQIRALPPEKGGQIPAIALTAYAREEDRQRALNSGYQRHVTKPLETDRLVRAVVALVRNERVSEQDARTS